MHNVFSNYVKSKLKDIKKIPADYKLAEALFDIKEEYEKSSPFIRKYWILKDPHIVLCSPLTTNEYNVEGTYTFEVFNNHELQSLIEWINREITLKLLSDNHPTVEIKIRIATSMLNKLVDNHSISKEYAILFHDILVANVRDCESVLWTEDLPF